MSSLPNYLHSTWNMLEEAYWDGIPEQDYFATLVVLKKHMSYRALVDVIAEFSRRDWGLVHNDVAAALSDQAPKPETIQRVAEKLRSHGLDAWIDETNQ